MMDGRFTLWEVTFVLYCLSLSLIEVDVNVVTPCINRMELLEGLLTSSGLENHIIAASFIPPYSPSEARTSGIGWCSDDITCNNSSERQFIEVDFGAEVIIEAVAILRAGGSYVTHYSVEYAGSDRDYHCVREQITNQSIFNGNPSCNSNMDPSNFANPVVARYIRIIPIQWVGASVCLRMKLFGCTIKECQNVNTVLPGMITISTTSTVDQVLNLSNYWCASGPAPQRVILSFEQSVYLTQLRARSNSVTFNMFLHTNQTLYRNILGLDSFRLDFNTRLVLPLWLPINTTILEFNLYLGVLNPVCFAVELTGCLSREVIDHSITSVNPAPSTNITSSDMPGCSINVETAITKVAITSTNIEVTITVTSTQLATCTTTLIITPSYATDQQTNDSESSCNAVAIPVVVAIVLIVGVIIFAAVWKCRKIYYYGSSLKVINTQNDLHGKNKNLINEATSLSTTDLSASVYTKCNDTRHEFVNPECVAVDKQQVKVIGAVTSAIKDDPALTYNPAYDTVNSGPLLSDNPAYIPIKDGLPAPTDSDPAIDQIYI